jgi:tRNA threonylcarbamoyladenosine modification (KEOPS) complex  Pcc1 subunit
MSTAPEAQQAESARSSVKLTRNAKGETQVEVKCYAADGEDVFTAEKEAISAYERLCARYSNGAAS